MQKTSKLDALKQKFYEELLPQIPRVWSRGNEEALWRAIRRLDVRQRLSGVATDNDVSQAVQCVPDLTRDQLRIIHDMYQSIIATTPSSAAAKTPKLQVNLHLDISDPEPLISPTVEKPLKSPAVAVEKPLKSPAVAVEKPLKSPAVAVEKPLKSPVEKPRRKARIPPAYRHLKQMPPPPPPQKSERKNEIKTPSREAEKRIEMEESDNSQTESREAEKRRKRRIEMEESDESQSQTENEEYEVEKIIEKVYHAGEDRYLVKWKDYPLDENDPENWLTREGLKDCLDLLKEFEANLEKQRKARLEVMAEKKRVETEKQQQKKYSGVDSDDDIEVDLRSKSKNLRNSNKQESLKRKEKSKRSKIVESESDEDEIFVTKKQPAALQRPFTPVSSMKNKQESSKRKEKRKRSKIVESESDEEEKKDETPILEQLPVVVKRPSALAPVASKKQPTDHQQPAIARKPAPDFPKKNGQESSKRKEKKKKSRIVVSESEEEGNEDETLTHEPVIVKPPSAPVVTKKQPTHQQQPVVAKSPALGTLMKKGLENSKRKEKNKKPRIVVSESDEEENEDEIPLLEQLPLPVVIDRPPMKNRQDSLNRKEPSAPVVTKNPPTIMSVVQGNHIETIAHGKEDAFQVNPLENTEKLNSQKESGKQARTPKKDKKVKPPSMPRSGPKRLAICSSSSEDDEEMNVDEPTEVNKQREEVISKKPNKVLHSESVDQQMIEDDVTTRRVEPDPAALEDIRVGQHQETEADQSNGGRSPELYLDYEELAELEARGEDGQAIIDAVLANGRYTPLSYLDQTGSEEHVDELLEDGIRKGNTVENDKENEDAADQSMEYEPRPRPSEEVVVDEEQEQEDEPSTSEVEFGYPSGYRRNHGFDSTGKFVVDEEVVEVVKRTINGVMNGTIPKLSPEASKKAWPIDPATDGFTRGLEVESVECILKPLAGTDKRRVSVRFFVEPKPGKERMMIRQIHNHDEVSKYAPEALVDFSRRLEHDPVLQMLRQYAEKMREKVSA